MGLGQKECIRILKSEKYDITFLSEYKELRNAYLYKTLEYTKKGKDSSEIELAFNRLTNCSDYPDDKMSEEEIDTFVNRVLSDGKINKKSPKKDVYTLIEEFHSTMNMLYDIINNT